MSFERSVVMDIFCWRRGRHDAPIDVNDLLKRLWEDFRQKASVHQLEVGWDLDGQGLIESDLELVKVVVGNVLENAVT